MSSWFYVKDGQRIGPMGREELDARAAEGALDGDTLVWRAGMPAWARAAELPELGLPPPVPPPPLPPPLFPASIPAPGLIDAPAAAASVLRPEFAGFRVRLAAKLIDLAILYAAAVLVERGLAALVFDGVVPVPPDWAGVLRMLAWSAPINTALALAYSVYFVRKHEATPGKRILGLRLVRADGGRVGAWRVIGRHFAEGLSQITFLAGYVMAAFDEEKRTLHDYICDTRVVRGERKEE